MGKFLFSLVFAAALTFLTYGFCIIFGWTTFLAINPWEAFALFTSYSCTYLCVIQTRWNYPIGVISTAAWSVFFFQLGSPALAAFNLYLVFSLAYGYFRWKPDADTRPVTTTSVKSYGWYTIFGLVITGLFLAANCYFSGLAFIPSVLTLNPLDVFLAALSGMAQFMLDRKKLESWYLWIIVNAISIPYFFMIGAPATAIQFIVFLGNAFWGLYEWKKSMKLGAENTGHFTKETVTV